MYALVVFFCLISTILADPDTDWETFKKKYNRMYKNDEFEAVHRAAFMNNKKAIDEHNEKYEKGLKKYTLKMNHFADFTPDEIKALFGKKSSEYLNKRRALRTKRDVSNETVNSLPQNFNWAKKGAVTPIKDQGLCGSCYVFSALAALESQLFLKRGKLVSLSVQNFLDCVQIDLKESADPCMGGSPLSVSKFIKKNQGIATESSYPYREKADNCTQDKIEHFKVGHPVFVDPEKIKEHVFTNGPVVAALDAKQFTFLFYSSGIYEDEDCKNSDLNHGAVIVGFGTEGKQDYWLVKNSWGTDWGEEGYVKIVMNKTENCGIEEHVIYMSAH